MTLCLPLLKLEDSSPPVDLVLLEFVSLPFLAEIHLCRCPEGGRVCRFCFPGENASGWVFAPVPQQLHACPQGVFLHSFCLHLSCEERIPVEVYGKELVSECKSLCV